jgi:hypothetical protein
MASTAQAPERGATNGVGFAPPEPIGGFLDWRSVKSMTWRSARATHRALSPFDAPSTCPPTTAKPIRVVNPA